VQALIAPLGLIITLSIAVVVMTFNSFRLTLIAFAVAGLSAGLSMLALAIFDYPFGINAIIGVIGSIGVSINAALIVLSGLQEDARASAGTARPWSMWWQTRPGTSPRPPSRPWAASCP
jgi:multidrug efflux pump subunit AcrB